MKRERGTKKVAKIVGLCSRPLQASYMMATPHERESLREIVDSESDWIIDKMRGKGYRLEGTVADIYGIFLRGPACGTIRLKDEVAAVP